MSEHIGAVCCRADEETLADAFEALVGAIYLDSGLEAASKFIIGLAEVRNFLPVVADFMHANLMRGLCTEYCQFEICSLPPVGHKHVIANLPIAC